MIEPLEIRDGGEDGELLVKMRKGKSGQVKITVPAQNEFLGRDEVRLLRDWLDNYLRESEE